MTERSIVTDCKSVARLGYIGSNPILGTNCKAIWDENKLAYSRHKILSENRISVKFFLSSPYKATYCALHDSTNRTNPILGTNCKAIWDENKLAYSRHQI